MGDDDKGLSETVAQVEEELMELFFVLTVQAARWLVGQDDGGIVDEGTRHCHTLFLTAGKLIGLVMGAVGELHELQQFLGTLLGFTVGCARNVGRNHDVLDGCELRQQLVELEDKAQMAVAEVGKFLLRKGGGVDAVNTDRSAVGSVEGADDLQQCGFSGAAGSDNADDFAFGDMQIDAFQYFQ